MGDLCRREMCQFKKLEMEIKWKKEILWGLIATATNLKVTIDDRSVAPATKRSAKIEHDDTCNEMHKLENDMEVMIDDANTLDRRLKKLHRDMLEETKNFSNDDESSNHDNQPGDGGGDDNDDDDKGNNNDKDEEVGQSSATNWTHARMAESQSALDLKSSQRSSGPFSLRQLHKYNL